MATKRQADISVPERLIFAVGDVFVGGASSLIAVLYLIFLTDVIKLSPGLAGTAVLVAKLWDAVNDPLIGALSDRTRTRFGRRRPFIFIGGLLLIPAMALLWLPGPPISSQFGLMLWAMFSYICYNTIQTIVAVPYASMSTEVARDYDLRNKVNTTRLLFSTVSSASVTLLAAFLFDQYRLGRLSLGGMYAAITLGMGSIFTLCMLAVAIWCQERAPIPASSQPMSWRTFIAPLRTPELRKLLKLYLCQALAMDLISASVLYYALYVVRSNSQIFLGTFIAVNALAFPVVTWLVGRTSKHLIYRRLLPVALLAGVGIAVYPTTWSPLGVYALALALAIGMAGAQLMSWVMFPDVLDAAELTTSSRDAGSFAGLMTFTRGIAAALVIQSLGLVLQLSGYLAPVGREIPAQPAAAVLAIRCFIGLGVVGLLALGWYFSRHYPLTRQVCLANQAELALRRGGENE